MVGIGDLFDYMPASLAGMIYDYASRLALSKIEAAGLKIVECKEAVPSGNAKYIGIYFEKKCASTA